MVEYSTPFIISLALTLGGRLPLFFFKNTLPTESPWHWTSCAYYAWAAFHAGCDRWLHFTHAIFTQIWDEKHASEKSALAHRKDCSGSAFTAVSFHLVHGLFSKTGLGVYPGAGIYSFSVSFVLTVPTDWKRRKLLRGCWDLNVHYTTQWPMAVFVVASPNVHVTVVRPLAPNQTWLILTVSQCRCACLLWKCNYDYHR